MPFQVSPMLARMLPAPATIEAAVLWSSINVTPPANRATISTTISGKRQAKRDARRRVVLSS